MINLAGVEGCDKEIRKELIEAGINILEFPYVRDGEVPTKIVGYLGPWSFYRAWYYWIASGDGIPPEIAEEFHKKHGQEVRVCGDCTSPAPSDRKYKNFAVGNYHIDTQIGLNAFAKLLKELIGHEE